MVYTIYRGNRFIRQQGVLIINEEKTFQLLSLTCVVSYQTISLAVVRYANSNNAVNLLHNQTKDVRNLLTDLRLCLRQGICPSADIQLSEHRYTIVRTLIYDCPNGVRTRSYQNAVSKLSVVLSANTVAAYVQPRCVDIFLLQIWRCRRNALYLYN